jgi:hypothetical protein
VSVDVRQILRERPGSFIGYFLPLLILSEENEKLLDVVELFGIDRLAEIIERLGGSTLVFPTWATVDTLVADAYLLYLLDDKRVDRKTLVEVFESPYESLRARARALRQTLQLERPFPGARVAKRWNRRLSSITEQIRQESLDA